MILSFSGTGNSRYIAALLSKALGDEIVDLNPLVSAGPCTFKSDKPYVVVCPTYCYSIPAPVNELLSRAEFRGSKEMYFIMTCGAGIGGADYQNDKLCKSIGMRCKGTAKFVMPDNYLCMYEPSTYDEARSLVDSAPERLSPLTEKIAVGSDFDHGGNVVSGAVSSVSAKAFNAFVGKPSKFHVSESCISCGLCEKNCPMRCISLKGGIPQWKSGCIHCLSCICGCPNDAIDYGKATKGRRRHYLYPDGTIKK